MNKIITISASIILIMMATLFSCKQEATLLYITKAGGIDLTESPEIGAKATNFVPMGEMVTRIGQKNKDGLWYRVNWKETVTGWALADSFGEPVNLIRWTTADAGLRVRNLPGLGGTRITTLDLMTEVTLIIEVGEEKEIAGETGRWSKIAFGEESDQTGWVFGGFLSEFGVGPQGYEEDPYGEEGGYGMSEVDSGTITDSVILNNLLSGSNWIPQYMTDELGELMSFRTDGSFISWADTSYADEMIKYSGTWEINSEDLLTLIIYVSDYINDGEHTIVCDYFETFDYDSGMVGLWLNVIMDGETLTLGGPVELMPDQR